MTGSCLPFLLPWVAVNVLIRRITGRVWPEDSGRSSSRIFDAR
jgi:hypothetical protein